MFIDVYKADDKTATSGATSLADINLRRTYRAIDSVATGRILSLFCDDRLLTRLCKFNVNCKLLVLPSLLVNVNLSNC